MSAQPATPATPGFKITPNIPPSSLKRESSNTNLLSPSTSKLSLRTRYADYTSSDTCDSVLSASLSVAALLHDVAALIPCAGPLFQVFGVTKELIIVIGDVRDIQDECNYLVERILNFMKDVGEEMTMMNIPVEFGTPTAARLFALCR